MKSNKIYRRILTSIIIALLVSINCIAQQTDLSNYRLRFNFKTVKQADNSRLLEASFIASNKDRKEKVPVYGAEIKFYNILNDKEIELGTAKTSKDGTAQLILPENQKYEIDNEGYINLKAIFEGTDAISEEDEELRVKDLHLDLNLKTVDSLKTVVLNAYTVDNLGTKIPVNDVDIIFYLKGMLSKKNIEEGTITDGSYEFNMSQNFSGDTKGNLTIAAIIDDNDDYGNIIKEQTTNWGTINKPITPDKNMLWTKAAPIWMYVVLTILLLGVWANYLYTVINLFKLKKEGSSIGIVQPK